jgi:hypothetical protein
MAVLPLTAPLSTACATPLDEPEEGSVACPELPETEPPEADDTCVCPLSAFPLEVEVCTDPLVVLLHPAKIAAANNAPCTWAGR